MKGSKQVSYYDNAISPTFKFFKIIHLKMSYLKMAPQEMEDFNPIYFFTILKRSLINLNILLTKHLTNTQAPPTMPWKATMVETAAEQHKLVKSWAAKGLWVRLKKKDPELLALYMKNKTGCSVYFHFDKLKGSWTQLISVSHTAHILMALTTETKKA